MVTDSYLLTRSLDRKQLNLIGWIQVVSVNLLWALCNLKTVCLILTFQRKQLRLRELNRLVKCYLKVV